MTSLLTRKAALLRNRIHYHETVPQLYSRNLDGNRNQEREEFISTKLM